MTITDPSTINATLAWALILGLPIVALAVNAGIVGAAVRYLTRKTTS